MIELALTGVIRKKAKPIECPCCGNERLIDAGVHTNTEAKIADEYHCEADFYIKCWKCKREIGLKKKT